MQDRSWIAIGLSLALGAGALTAIAMTARSVEGRDAPSDAPSHGPSSSPLAVEAPASIEPAARPAHVRWIGIGGGPEPELNQISLEDDLLLVRDVLGPGGVLLFAGGPGTRSVQVQVEGDRGDPLRRMLGDLLSGRGGRDAQYLPTRLELHGPATWDALASELGEALSDGDDPLTLWIAAHGEGGEMPADSRALLWSGTSVDPVRLDAFLSDVGPRRSLRLVVTSCYSGGFAELAFDGAEPTKGPSRHDVCGFFATSWDEEASGCDPSPERASHESWALHFLEALRGRGRDGADLRESIDLDHDGRVSMHEADARARIASLSIDVPTTTSARLLRAIVPRESSAGATPASPARAAFELPAEEAVMRAIGERLRIAGRSDVEARLDALARRRVEIDDAIAQQQDEADALWYAFVGALLSRWPVLDDPWHPDFDATLGREGPAIRAFLEGSRELAAWDELQGEIEALDASSIAVRIEAAPLRRWLEAYETRELASRLAAAGGEGWDRWQRMRACEDGFGR